MILTHIVGVIISDCPEQFLQLMELGYRKKDSVNIFVLVQIQLHT